MKSASCLPVARMEHICKVMSLSNEGSEVESAVFCQKLPQVQAKWKDGARVKTPTCACKQLQSFKKKKKIEEKKQFCSHGDPDQIRLNLRGLPCICCFHVTCNYHLVFRSAAASPDLWETAASQRTEVKGGWGNMASSAPVIWRFWVSILTYRLYLACHMQPHTFFFFLEVFEQIYVLSPDGQQLFQKKNVNFIMAIFIAILWCIFVPHLTSQRAATLDTWLLIASFLFKPKNTLSLSPGCRTMTY